MPHSIAAWLIALAAATPSSPQVAAPALAQGGVAQCAAADDPKYGLSVDAPIQVGGGAAYGPARERQYLGVLRGPAGQVLKVRRTGSTILAAYEVSYDGLATPVMLYVDEYHFGDLAVPRGFTCGQALALPVPSADPFQTLDSVLTVAVEQGATQEFAPIPVDPDGTTTHGVMFDHFRLVALASRAASARGVTLNPKALPREVARVRTVVVAAPLACEGRTIPALSIEVVGVQGPARRDPEYARDADIASLLPGARVPVSSLAATFALQAPRMNDTIRITYAEPCGTAPAQVDLPVAFTRPATVDTPTPPLPDGVAVSSSPVRLQALVDLNGTLRRATYVGGPVHLSTLAIEAVSHWKSEPPRINGAPLASGVIVQVKFKP
jgi:hypothetical protein